MTNRLTIIQARDLLAKKQTTSKQLVKDCLSQITKKNKRINAYIKINPSAIDQAKQVDRKGYNLPLSGIPVAVKDNFVTKNFRTSAASKVLDDYIPQYSATVVDKLEKAGAIILGKTNLDAWCHGSSTETSDFGPTRNPWNTDYLPGGSSGGSAATISADMALGSIGSETAGSIRGPAAWCGCVGLKPTYGRVSRYGVIAMGSSLDCPGPMTKSVKDAALILTVLAGRDKFDATTSYKPVEDYLELIEKGIKGLKIAIAQEHLLPQMDKKIKDSIKAAGKLLERLGAKVDYAKALNPKYAIGVYTIIQRSEVYSNLARYDGVRYGKTRKAFGHEAKKRMMLGSFSLSAGYTDQYYKKAQKVRTLFRNDFDKLFSKYDLIIGPTMPGIAPKVGTTSSQAMFGEMADMLAEPSSISGLPGISVPCGFIDNMPIGLNIMGPQFSETKILQAAYAYEQATNWHQQKPKL